MRRFFLGKLISGSFVPKISGLGGHGCWAQNWPGMRRPKVTSEIMAHLQMFSPPSAALLLWLRGHLAVAKGKNRAGGACGGPFLNWPLLPLCGPAFGANHLILSDFAPPMRNYLRQVILQIVIAWAQLPRATIKNAGRARGRGFQPISRRTYGAFIADGAPTKRARVLCGTRPAGPPLGAWQPGVGRLAKWPQAGQATSLTQSVF